jgi:hypothetical protein
VSADFRTEHFKGYLHPDGDVPYIHIRTATDDYPLGTSLSLGEIGELVQLAGQAWASATAVQVRYVIEARRGYDGTLSNPHPWAVMWSAVADEDNQAGVSEDFAKVTFGGMSVAGALEWRLVCRTTVTADEVLGGESDG